MITRELAERLQGAGLVWTPASGDRFMIPDRDLDDDLFVISEMTIEVHEILGRRIIKFHGTTEWALDSITADLVLWLPREDQLRDALGERFAALERTPFGFVVTCADGSRHADVDAERAYARALLGVLGR